MAQTVKNLPAIQETQVQSLGWGETLEKGMATHSSTLAWKIPWTEEPGRLESKGSDKAMVFPVVMYGCESWTIKKTESQRTDAFELWFWRRLLRVFLTARRLNQSILQEISPEYSLEGLMLKLKLQYFGHLMQRTNSLGMTLMLGKVEGKNRRGTVEDEVVRYSITNSMNMNLSKLGDSEGQACCSP